MATDAADYLNPVYPHSFPDPFVLKHCGEYFAYCTGHDAGGDVFSILRSHDLVNWSPAGAAMKPLDSPAPFYWAPEVNYADGRFHLYYSVGNETFMELRVAVSERPDGGFVDAGVRLTKEDFAIDAHVFIDDDGTKYLFYATDFLEHTHIGTGTVVDRLIDWFTLAGTPRPVTRAKYDWQVYDPQRKEKGGVRWHTVEGPSVFKRKGTYFEMFSGGNWQNTTYGVSFAVTDDISAPDEWQQFSDGEKVLPILRTIPDTVIGPGHNCIVRGPNNRELYCVYHRWTDAGRVLAIDRMDVVGRRLFVVGATNTPQPAPFEPQVSGFSDGWQTDGEWQIDGDTARGNAAGLTSLSRSVPQSFLCEFNIRNASGNPEYAFVSIARRDRAIEISVGNEVATGALGFIELSRNAAREVRFDVDGRWLKCIADGWRTIFEGWVETAARQLVLTTENLEVEFTGFSLTEGFEDSFDRVEGSLSDTDWNSTMAADAPVHGGELHVESADGESRLFRDEAYDELDVAVNIRSADVQPDGSGFGIILTAEDGTEDLRLAIGADIAITTRETLNIVPLPAGWDPRDYHQYRLLVRGAQVIVYLEDHEIAAVQRLPGPLCPAVFCNNTHVKVEMFRVTRL
jgi:GH43 family beta-xylosidase